MSATETLKWSDSTTPACLDCQRLLFNPLFADAFYTGQHLNLTGARRLERFHIDDHQLRPEGDGS